MLRRSSQETLWSGALNARGVAKYVTFGYLCGIWALLVLAALSMQLNGRLRTTFGIISFIGRKSTLYWGEKIKTLFRNSISLYIDDGGCLQQKVLPRQFKFLLISWKSRRTRQEKSVGIRMRGFFLTLSPPIPLRPYTLPYWSVAPECPNVKK